MKHALRTCLFHPRDGMLRPQTQKVDVATTPEPRPGVPGHPAACRTIPHLRRSTVTKMLHLLSHPLLCQVDGLLLRAGSTELDCMTLARTILASPAHDLPPAPLHCDVRPFVPAGHWTLDGGGCWLPPHSPRLQGCQGNIGMVTDSPNHLQVRRRPPPPSGSCFCPYAGRFICCRAGFAGLCGGISCCCFSCGCCCGCCCRCCWSGESCC